MAERILQFGTGRFLRAFADCFIDAANKSGHYNGQIVMVASTPSGRQAILNRQHGRYGLWVRGSDIDSLQTIHSVSRVLAAATQWPDVLALARSRSLEAVVSNTTEVGIGLQDQDSLDAPRSYPARLAAILHERALHFEFAPDRGLVILPCELIEDNATRLSQLVLEQSRRWNLGKRFYTWMQRANTFCNTLVDRIVPGLPSTAELASAYHRLGNEDPLLTVCEPYRLWAVEGAPSVSEKLGFLAGDPGIVVTDDITAFRLRKIRLLNGGHTLTVPVGLILGCATVLEHVEHPLARRFIEGLLRKEIGPILQVPPQTVAPYIDEVLRRWSNPFMHHRLIDITLESTTKLRHRAVPSLLEYYEAFGRAPLRMALGFAAWLRFMRGHECRDGVIYGELGQYHYPIHDSMAGRFLDWWPSDHAGIHPFVQAVFGSRDLWGTDLNGLPGFAESVANSLRTLLAGGPEAALEGT